MLERRFREALAAFVALLVALPLLAPGPVWADDLGADDEAETYEAAPTNEPAEPAEPETEQAEPEAEPAEPETGFDDSFAMAAAKTFDLLVLRPLTLGWTIFGFALFLPAAIAATDTIEESWTFFVYEPAEATFMTPLGDFVNNPDY